MAFPYGYEFARHHLEEAVSGAGHGLYAGSVEALRRLEINHDDHVFVLAKQGESWYSGATPVNEHVTRMLEELAQMLSGAEPVRTFHPEDLVAVHNQDYGFDGDNKLMIRDAQGQTLNLEFGHATPDGSLHYVRKQGDPALYVMSGFLQSQIRSLGAALHETHEHSHE